ncbi:MAG: AAA family ATPase [Sedimentisphaerales bacterium]|nr:AAA family ATPase [Sedimentisphaerales bacterium]
MKGPLDKIQLSGFKSIRQLEEFPLGNLNILVGCNGAGKSNFIDFFRMLRAMSEGNLTGFITKKGGADSFFYNGPNETRQIKSHLIFGKNQYRSILEPSAIGLMVKIEEVLWTGNNKWTCIGGGQNESRLPDFKNMKSSWGDWPSIEAHVYETVSSWSVYHFHDTSFTAPMRREQHLRDNRILNPEASNIAAYLFYLQRNHAQRYERIKESVKLVAPFFDDFLLEPETKGENELIRLEWRQRGSSFPFQPWDFSDGTLRFICLATLLLQPSLQLPSTVLIDEPELGLHPFALDVLAGLMREASESTQLIVSTQSASLLNHFTPSEVIVVDRESGASTFKHLEESDFASWLEEYSLGELWQKNVFEGGPRHE